MKTSKVIFIHAEERGLVSKGGSYTPLVSFVIPTLNSERTLEKCLGSIVQQDYALIEILVIDSGSTDNSIAMARRFGARIYFLKGSLGDVRRLGIDNSSGELISLWDSDVYIQHSKWLSRSVSVLRSFPRASTLWIHSTHPPNAGIVARAYHWYSWMMMLNFAKKGIGFWGGGVSIFRRGAIVDIGGITRGVDTGEDYDLAKKLAKEGYETIFYDDPVYHDTHNTLNELVRKDIRRAKNFKKKGLTRSTGIPLVELVKMNLKIGLSLSLKNLFTKKEAYFGIVPILILLRLIIYTIVHLLP